jgi:hypothetical protein
MLEDLVGMVQGLDGDDDVELGSYQNSENLRPRNIHHRVPSTNTTSYDFQNKMNMEEVEMQKLTKGREDQIVSHNI